MRESNEANEMSYLEKCRMMKLENKNYHFVSQKWKAPYEFVQRIMQDDKSFKKDIDRIKFVKAALAYGATWEDLRIQGYLTKSEVRRYEKKYEKLYEQYHPKQKPAEKSVQKEKKEQGKPQYTKDLFDTILSQGQKVEEQYKRPDANTLINLKNKINAIGIARDKPDTPQNAPAERKTTIEKKVQKEFKERLEKIDPETFSKRYLQSKARKKAEEKYRTMYDTEAKLKEDGMIPLYPYITKEFGNRYALATKLDVALIIIGITAAGNISKDKLLDLITK